MRVVVGRIVRAHGLRGDVLVDPRTDQPEQRFAWGQVLDTDAAGDLTVTSSGPYGDRWRVRFAEAGDRAASDGLRGVWLYVESDRLERSEHPDEFHDTELVGLAAVDRNGATIGTVADVRHPAQDLLVIERSDGTEALVPFVRALVPEVDLAAGRLVVDAPPGLLEGA